MSRNCARALTLQVDDEHSMREGGMVEGIALGFSLLRDAPANVQGWTRQTPSSQLGTVLSCSLDVKNYAWAEEKT